jgi:protein SCO1/2
MKFLLLTLALLQAPESVITAIGVDQKLGGEVDPQIQFRDERGRAVRLGDFFQDGKPVVVTPVYFKCPMLCGMQFNGLLKALRVLPFTAGKEFGIVSFSIDPDEGPDLAAAQKEHYIRDYRKPEAAAGWHFLTSDAESIARITDQLGFRYRYDEATGQWAHASTLVVMTPDGRISQYFHGIEYDPADLRLSLIEAAGGRIGSIIDRALLYCYQYDPSTGRYSLAIMRVVRAAGVTTVLGLLAFVVWPRKRA